MNRRRFYRDLSHQRTNDVALNPLRLTLFNGSLFCCKANGAFSRRWRDSWDVNMKGVANVTSI